MSDALNVEALRPLYAPWQEPNKHRSLRGSAEVVPGRRQSRCSLAKHLRHEVGAWRHNGYIGASETTKTLLRHWFETAHTGGFRYYWCQREAIETIIWLLEVVRYRSLSSMMASLLEESLDSDLIETVTPEEDAWAKYCTKIATGGGKTKVMSLAIVWSYFHRLFEPDSDMAQHFVVIAPNLIVFERLRDDFGDGRIFRADPLIPQEWDTDFHLDVVTQDDPGGATSRGTLYLTNIHRLYDRPDEADNGGQGQYPRWSAPPVRRAKALRTGADVRKRIAAHPCIMVINDEAHHLHDPGSAWNEALGALHKQSKERGNDGVVAQLDFTATPKHNDGRLFRHIVSDFPLGEAVDAGIVKVPVVGKSDALKPLLTADTADARWRPHLKIGYVQYARTYPAWEKTHKPILFVMTEDTKAASQIAKHLDSDDYPLLKGRVLNLHTKLKGKLKKVKRGGKMVAEFEESESQMSDADLAELRALSRDLDKPDSPYRCVVSVLMLREGWDIKNVTTIVPLRAYSAESGILPEQTLGRGLRRMEPPGDDAPLERVTCVEHSAFLRMYKEELESEGLDIASGEVDDLRPETVTIFVDQRKPVADLDIAIPRLTDAVLTTASLGDIEYDEVVASFGRRCRPLPIGRPGQPIVFEERTLYTDELIAQFEMDRGLLRLGATAVPAFVRDLERACRLQSTHPVLAPLLTQFIQEALFERAVNLYSGEVDHRIGDADVVETVRATFVPLLRSKTTEEVERVRSDESRPLSAWKPYQATQTPDRPCVAASRTLFNLVPCNRSAERDFADFCDAADDVAAFAKNGGPQRLSIDYMAAVGRPAFYIPDLFVRGADGTHYLVETKGRVDADVPLKAQAAIEWCETASTKAAPWQYLYVPMQVLDAAPDFRIESLYRACAPRLKEMLAHAKSGQLELPLEFTPEEVRDQATERVLADAGVAGLPDSIRRYVSQAVNQLAYDRKKGYPQFGDAFQPLLYPIEDLCGQILAGALGPCMPADPQARKDYFDPYLDDLSSGARSALQKNQRLLEKNLVHGARCNRIGVLLFCLDYAATWRRGIAGIWRDVEAAFDGARWAKLRQRVEDVNRFRNTFVAHVEEPLTDAKVAETAMREWIRCIGELVAATTPSR